MIFETGFFGDNQLAGQQFLSKIVQQRGLGVLVDGMPQTGQGLADIMARMAQNFQIQAGQLGFTNPQVETNRFSLRRECFRIPMGTDGDEDWRAKLSSTAIKKDDIWSVADVARFCVPPAEYDGRPQPGFVIPFTTTVTEGENFFGQRLGGFDSAYDSTKFATKIRSVGVWFSNYDNRYAEGLSNTPRVYLVPAGQDVLRSPSDLDGAPRYFTVLDQVLPTPFPLTGADLDDPEWMPSLDEFGVPQYTIRRYGRFRAYHDSGQFDESEVFRDSRLVGRSVWNNWLLVIPQSALYVPDTGEAADAGLEKFIGSADDPGVSDILLFFETYAYSRLKEEDPKAKAVSVRP